MIFLLEIKVFPNTSNLFNLYFSTLLKAEKNKWKINKMSKDDDLIKDVLLINFDTLKVFRNFQNIFNEYTYFLLIPEKIYNIKIKKKV